MTTLFKRSVTVTTFRENVPGNPTNFKVTRSPNTTIITDLRVQFRVTRTLTKHPNACDITITNLASTTRIDLETKPLLVQLNAGYDGNEKLLYVGDLRFGMTKQSGANWETLLQLGDGDCMHRWARVNKSYKAGTSVRAVLKDAARSMGFELPKNLDADKSLDRAFASGTTSYGPSRDELTRLLSPFGYHWSIQNGVLTILADNQASSTTALALDEDHGMIGTPEFGSPPRSGKPPHMTVNNLLYPELSPGNMVYLTSKVKTGFFKLESVKHTGDTHSAGENSWCTTVEIKPLLPPEVETPSTSAKSTGPDPRAFPIRSGGSNGTGGL